MTSIRKTKKVDLSRLHDVMVDVLENRKYSEAEVQECFNRLPKHIQYIAFEWGGTDTVFGDEAYEFLEKEKKA